MRRIHRAADRLRVQGFVEQAAVSTACPPVAGSSLALVVAAMVPSSVGERGSAFLDERCHTSGLVFGHESRMEKPAFVEAQPQANWIQPG